VMVLAPKKKAVPVKAKKETKKEVKKEEMKPATAG